MGQQDVPACDAGVKEAALNAQKLSLSISWIVSSPLQRAMRTAEVFSNRYGVPIKTSPNFMERFWGVFEGKPKGARSAHKSLVDAEIWSDFRRRVDLGVCSLPMDGKGIVVSHSGVFRALLSIGYEVQGNLQSIPHAQPIVLRLTSCNVNTDSNDQ